MGFFAEAVYELSDYQAFADAISVPLLANITEFGATPLYNKSQLAHVGVDMVLYPLSAFRAMSKAALNRLPAGINRWRPEGRHRHHANSDGAL